MADILTNIHDQKFQFSQGRIVSSLDDGLELTCTNCVFCSGTNVQIMFDVMVMGKIGALVIKAGGT